MLARESQTAAREARTQTAVAERVPPLRSSVGTGTSDMADLPGGASELLCRNYKGKEADWLVTRIDPGGSRWSRNSAATSARPPRNWASGRPASRSPGPSTPRRRRSRWPWC